MSSVIGHLNYLPQTKNTLQPPSSLTVSYSQQNFLKNKYLPLLPILPLPPPKLSNLAPSHKPTNTKASVDSDLGASSPHDPAVACNNFPQLNGVFLRVCSCAVAARSLFDPCSLVLCGSGEIQKPKSSWVIWGRGDDSVSNQLADQASGRI